MTQETPSSGVYSLLRKRLPFEIVSTLLVLALIAYALRNTDFGLVWGHLQAGVGLPIFIGLGISAAVFVGHGFRLSVLLKQKFLPSFYIVNLGALLNSVLPFRIGDIARIYLSRKYFGIQAAKLLGAAVLEKFFDLMSVGVLMSLAVFGGATRFFSIGLVASLVAVAMAVVAGLIFIAHSGTFSRYAARLPFSIERHIGALRQQLAIKDLPALICATLVIWGLNLACATVVFNSLLPGASLNLYDIASLTVITALAVAIPGAPAGIGIFEAGVVAYLMQVHAVSYELALASALIFHAIIVFPPVAGLLLGIARRGR